MKLTCLAPSAQSASFLAHWLFSAFLQPPQPLPARLNCLAVTAFYLVCFYFQRGGSWRNTWVATLRLPSALKHSWSLPPSIRSLQSCSPLDMCACVWHSSSDEVSEHVVAPVIAAIEKHPPLTPPTADAAAVCGPRPCRRRRCGFPHPASQKCVPGAFSPWWGWSPGCRQCPCWSCP